MNANLIALRRLEKSQKCVCNCCCRFRFDLWRKNHSDFTVVKQISKWNQHEKMAAICVNNKLKEKIPLTMWLCSSPLTNAKTNTNTSCSRNEPIAIVKEKMYFVSPSVAIETILSHFQTAGLTSSTHFLFYVAQMVPQNIWPLCDSNLEIAFNLVRREQKNLSSFFLCMIREYDK